MSQLQQINLIASCDNADIGHQGFSILDIVNVLELEIKNKEL